MQEPLYRVRVLLHDDKAINVGPAMIKEAAVLFCDAIKAKIRTGEEKVWRDPIYFPAYN